MRAQLVSQTGRGHFRPFERRDIGEVVRLFDRAYRGGPGRASPECEALYEDVFFDAPCQVGSKLDSLIWEDEQGCIGGFCGMHPRSLMLNGQMVSAATPGQLMMAPELRGLGIGLELVDRFFHGGQDVTFCVSAGDATRAITTRLGGTNPKEKGLLWRKVIRPRRSLARRVSLARKLGPLRHLASPFVANMSRDRAAEHDDPPPLETIETVYQRAFADLQFHPVFEADHMKWKLRTAVAANRPGMLARVVDVGDGPVGWYVWFLEFDGTASVVDLVCVPGHYQTVVEHLLQHAGRTAAESIGGYCHSAPEAEALTSAGASLWYVESKFLFHTCNTDWRKAFPDGPQYLSVFDGEGWIEFPR